MLDFLLELEKVLKVWPDGAKWSIVQIADKTKAKVPYVVNFLSDVLSKSLDVHDPLSFTDVSKAYTLLKERYRPELEAMQLREQQEIQKSVDAYEQTMTKIRVMETTKNWRAAYKTVNYFYGIHHKKIPTDLKVNLCNECLRLGIKENINFQELSQWLKRGIQHLISRPSGETIEDALDFLDAYGDYFLSEPRGKGEHFLTNLFLMLKPSAMEFDLSGKLNEVAGELKLESVMDVYL